MSNFLTGLEGLGCRCVFSGGGSGEENLCEVGFGCCPGSAVFMIEAEEFSFVDLMGTPFGALDWWHLSSLGQSKACFILPSINFDFEKVQR